MGARVIHPVILAGGFGSRLWPLSRSSRPKQFLDPLQQGLSLLQSTVKRAQLCSNLPIHVIANKDHRFLLSHHLEPMSVPNRQILLESQGCNTACSVLMAALKIAQINAQGFVLVLPSDQYVSDDVLFANKINQAARALGAGEMALMGVEAGYAATQFGYLQLGSNQLHEVNDVLSFTEKPNKQLAQEYLESGRYVWNAGVVLARAEDLLAAIKNHLPNLYSEGVKAFNAQNSLFDFQLIDTQGLESISFDYGVLEKEQNIKAVVLNSDWDDLGSWSALIKRRQSLGLNKNVFYDGAPDGLESDSSLSKAELVFTGDDLVVVNDQDLLMVANLDQLSDLSHMTQYLHDHGLSHLLKGLDVHRPWGSFKVLSQGDGFLVKQLCVLAGQRISLQSHGSRCEHWVVTKGLASVQLEDEMFELKAGQAITIGQRQKHRLSNLTNSPLQIIEVQTGSQLDESDIVRYDDSYERPVQ